VLPSISIEPMGVRNMTRPMRAAARVLVSRDDLWDMGIRLSVAQRNKMIARGEFPRAIRLTASKLKPMWVLSEIEAWIRSRQRMGDHQPRNRRGQYGDDMTAA